MILPDFLIADFYKDNLVLTYEKTLVPTAKHASLPNENTLIIINEDDIKFNKPKFLGGNKKSVSIMVRDEDAVYLKDEWLLFLTNILNACKLTIDDVAIFNVNHNDIFYSELLTLTHPKFVIMFDVESSKIKLPFIIPYYQLQEFNNISFLSVPSLSLMLGNTENVKVEKTKLWGSLKKMFAI